MRNYLKDGRLKIDNNLAENAIRPIALSRKNFLFCGNHEAALPILEQLEKWMETAYPKVLPKSRMGQAIAYAYQLWPRMRNYLKDGRLKIDNNLAENAIRPIALSRKNFLFCGNHEAAQNTAIICSLLASCKASNINPREWLTEVIALLPYYAANKEKDLKELLPHCWESGNSKEL
ncbi:IS66 family transposase [Bacteroides thetaiotaomicron]|nr:IS66 family transposase [Bacteroides thetaiotaomicron]